MWDTVHVLRHTVYGWALVAVVYVVTALAATVSVIKYICRLPKLLLYLLVVLLLV